MCCGWLNVTLRKSILEFALNLVGEFLLTFKDVTISCYSGWLNKQSPKEQQGEAGRAAP